MIEANYEIEVEKIGQLDIQSSSKDEHLSSEIEAYPNPFNSNINISYSLPQPGHVTIEIFDVLGRKVDVLKDEFSAAGVQYASWDGKNSGGEKVSSGLYFCKLRLDSREQIVKLHFLK